MKNGDLLKIDAGLIYEKGVSDSAISMIVGDASANPLGADLIRATKASLDRGVATIKTGGFAYDYGKAVLNTIINEGFRVLKTLSGHGVGNDVHEMPLFLNYPAATMKKIQWTPGMVVALEPITAVESDDVVYHDINDWNLYCRKGDLGAQWEYTVLITENGPEILAGVTEDWY